MEEEVAAGGSMAEAEEASTAGVAFPVEAASVAAALQAEDFAALLLRSRAVVVAPASVAAHPASAAARQASVEGPLV